MLVAIGDEGGVGAELVEDDARHPLVTTQGDRLLLTAEHTEGLAAVGRHILCRKGIGTLTGQVGDADAQHPIHAIMTEGFGGAVVSNEIIILIVPHQRPRAEGIQRAVVAEMLLLIHPPVEILEGDLLACRHSGLQTVHVVEDTLVHGLNATAHQHLPLQLTCQVAAGQALQTADELLALLAGDELGGLHRIYQQTKLWHIQGAFADIIPHGGVADGNLGRSVTKILDHNTYNYIIKVNKIKGNKR